jgi:hypothetical protein
MLYEPERHETLTEIAWDERLAREVISEIVADSDER